MHCVDLGESFPFFPCKSFPMHMHLQNLSLIQRRKRLVKLARFSRTDPPGKHPDIIKRTIVFCMSTSSHMIIVVLSPNLLFRDARGQICGCLAAAYHQRSPSEAALFRPSGSSFPAVSTPTFMSTYLLFSKTLLSLCCAASSKRSPKPNSGHSVGEVADALSAPRAVRFALCV